MNHTANLLEIAAAIGGCVLNACSDKRRAGYRPASAQDARRVNLCPRCGEASPLADRTCRGCGHALLHDARGAIALWRIGAVRNELLTPLAQGLADAFGLRADIHPAIIPDDRYHRPGWNGLAVTPMLNDLLARHRSGTRLNLGVTESNIVPDAQHNFLFGMAYVGQPAAVMGIDPLTWDEPSPRRLRSRMLHIAVHELGHCLGLDHHGYDDGVDCVMIGDDEIDSTEGIDSGSTRFCRACLAQIRRNR